MRITYREWLGHLKEPRAGEVKWQEGHSADTALGKARELLDAGVCWLFLEDTDKDYKGNSTERPKPKKGKSK